VDLTRFLLLSAVTVFLAAGTSARPLDFSRIVAVTPPATAGESGEPNLTTTARGEVFLSWIEQTDSGHQLRFASRVQRGWSEGRTIAAGDNWFVNWADYPSLVVLPGGAMVAHWLQKSGEDTYAYDVRISRSGDGGNTWTSGITPHRDGTQTEHGFVSMLPWSGNDVVVVWLDGRKFAPGEDGLEAAKEMTLRAAVMNDKGELSDEIELDGRVCDCCQTTGTRTRTGALFAYRDRSPDEIRDISVVRYTQKRWDTPFTLYNDGWKIPGCPVNGPAAASIDSVVAVAWFTVASDVGRVKVAFSNDDGESFGAPMRVDDGNPMGRVDVLLLDDATALVSWLEAVGEAAQIRVRLVNIAGSRGDSHTLTTTSQKRASGFPVMSKNDNEIVFAWTEIGEPPTAKTAIKTAVLPIQP
jgi:hypothetical protein